MPDRPQSTPSDLPAIDPAHWEQSEGIRSTLLARFTRPEDAAALARLGHLLFELSLENSGHWPRRPMGGPREEGTAGLAELHFLIGYFRSIGEEHLITELDTPNTRVSLLAGDIALDLKVLADRLAAELARAAAGGGQ
jgi:hypothetical protein